MVVEFDLIGDEIWFLGYRVGRLDVGGVPPFVAAQVREKLQPRQPVDNPAARRHVEDVRREYRERMYGAAV